MALLLAVAMIVTTCPQWVKTVQAAELPNNTQFATKEQLKSFNTNDSDGEKNPAKVYFGNNNQQWWVAGSQQEQGLTLFAATPLATNQQFEPDKDNNKIYRADWNCTYAGEEPIDVYANHYGASPLRKTLQGLETSYFTSAEQALMKDTTVYTKDALDGRVYSTTDKLYLAYDRSLDVQLITVGKNTSVSLYNGLCINKSYWENSGPFWLRAPSPLGSKSVLVPKPEYGYVHYDYVNNAYALVPAFELNLSSVIFASAAPAASSNGDLTLQNTAGDGAFTLRYAATNLGSALVSYDKSKVKLTNVPNDTYLVVQYNAEAKAKQIANETEVSATEMGLANFANCKVWLESTDSEARMTYATLATEELGYDVYITAGNGLVVTNGNQGVGQGTAITDIIVEAAEGYYLPDDYISNLQGQLNNGLLATKTDHGFTISGTPTSNVNIKLPAATPKPVSGSGGGGGSIQKLSRVYRAYNPNNGEHLYTLDEKEYKHVTSLGWHDEGVAFMAETEKNGQALYRVYNPNSGLHHYTSDENEKNMLVSLGWDEEGIAWYASNKPQSAPVYRVYNPNDGQHHYTMDGHEKDVLVSLGWTYEGIAFKTAPIE
ncbi:MAG: hypothetical protein Q4A59_02270 [Erysipelotrichaceae bacterium]|nr:hypothetical protein [Erysipelotrichaceae bacterium]